MNGHQQVHLGGLHDPILLLLVDQRPTDYWRKDPIACLLRQTPSSQPSMCSPASDGWCSFDRRGQFTGALASLVHPGSCHSFSWNRTCIQVFPFCRNLLNNVVGLLMEFRHQLKACIWHWPRFLFRLCSAASKPFFAFSFFSYEYASDVAILLAISYAGMLVAGGEAGLD